MYDDHLTLIGKRVMDFLLVLIELFSLTVTAEALFKIGDFAPTGPVNRKFQVEGSPRPHQPFFFSENYRLNGLSYGVKIWTNFSFALSQFTRLTDRQTRGQTFSSLDRVCIPCSAVKTS